MTLAKVGLNNTVVRARIDRIVARATEDNVLEAKLWYAHAHALAVELSDNSDLTLMQAAAVIAHLSPKVLWSRNKAAAEALVYEGRRLPGIMRGPYERALKAMSADDPLDTFGPDAKKTRSFALNIAGLDQEVTVDVWIARAVGVTEAQLKWVGVYEGIAHCFRLAAKRHGLSPMQVQALVWIVVRGTAN